MRTRDAVVMSVAAMMIVGVSTEVQAGRKPRPVSAKASVKKINVKRADQDKNGRVSASELKDARKAIAEKKAVVDKKWEEKADKDDSGTISKEEYRKASTHNYLKNRSEVDKKWEAKADVDGSGSVSGAEYKKFRNTQMDKDGSGSVSKQERDNYWKQRKSRANTDREKKYDADGDGYLDGDEAKEMLRDRLRIINTQGRAKVDGALEREFDANDDGIIDRAEAAAMKDAVG